MRFEAREIRLKDGRTCVLRPPAPEDAEALIAYMKGTAAETDFLLRYPDEISYTVEGERAFIERALEDPGQAMMTAVVDGAVAGNCSLSGIGDKRRIRHRCSVAIALYRDYWGLGLGSAMLSYLSELARRIGFEQMDLEVVAENERAQALYRKCGFVETGRRWHALKMDDGTYHDEILMVKEL